MNRIVTYRGNELTLSINQLCPAEINVSSFQCQECKKEIWQGRYKDKFIYQDNAEHYNEGMFLDEVRQIIRSEG